MNVYKKPLEKCGENTGFTRNKKCEYNKGDSGKHHVCFKNISKPIVNDKTFCSITDQPNWCKNKNNWCVCEWALAKAVDEIGCELIDIDCKGTNYLVIDSYKNNPKYKKAYDCLKTKCGIF